MEEINVHVLSEAEIEENKQEFLSLVNSLTIEGVDKEGLINYLESSDFFTAPASTKYHAAYYGGLCKHSLNVYKILSNLVSDYGHKCSSQIDQNSIIIAALFHDLSKTNFYEASARNVKQYSPNGTKSDNLGKFDWISQESFNIKDASDRMLYADHGTNSMYLISKYIPLSDEESCAIVNHHAGMDNNMANRDLTAIYNRYSLAALLHAADFIATYIAERI